MTPREIEDRFEEAALTLKRLPNPPASGPRGYGRSWPDYVHEARHAYGYEPARMRVIPNACEIQRMEEALDWLALIGGEPALQIEMMDAAKLVPYARNARTHSEDQIAQIAASIAEFGFTNPILIGGGAVIIAGHGRLMAAQKLGLSEVPVIVLDHLTEAQRRALVIADNRIAENAGWDEELLRAELESLREIDFDLDLIGFSESELDALLGDLDGGDDGAVECEDEVPEPPTDPVSRPGDLRIMGNLRLLCGDSTVATDVERLLAGVKPLLMVTDPPYGVKYDPSWRNQSGASVTKRTGKVLNDDRADWREAWALFPGNVAYVRHGALHATTVADSLIACGFNIRSQIVWAKDRLVLSRGDYHWQHEPCWYAVRKTDKGHWAGDRKQTTLWHIANRDQDAETVHGTQKPVECMRRPILNNSSPGQAIYEPFMGSGTTLIAAETTGRVYYGIVVEPRLCRCCHCPLAEPDGSGGGA